MNGVPCIWVSPEQIAKAAEVIADMPGVFYTDLWLVQSTDAGELCMDSPDGHRVIIERDLTTKVVMK